MRMYKFTDEDFRWKCGCNYQVANKYVLADTREGTQKELDNETAGPCSDCIRKLLDDYGYTIIPGGE